MNKIIEIKETDIPDGVSYIIEQLPSASELSAGDEVILRFSREFVYVTGLVLLAAWRKSLGEAYGSG